MLKVWLLVESTSDTVTQKIPNYGITIRFRMLLDRRGNITESIARQCLGNTDVQTFLRNPHQSLRFRANLTNRITPAGITEPSAIFCNDIKL
ncbi:hypothetical protein D3C73_1162220 [compost metagenome]